MPRNEKLFWQLLNGEISQSEVVIQSLDRRKALYRDLGWIYVLRNPAFRKGLLKIGKTSRFPTERARELGRRTGMPEGFQVLHYIHVSDHHAAEAYAHQLLADERYRPDREFFEVPLKKAVRVLDQVAETFPLVVKSGRTAHVIPQDYGETKNVRCRSCSAMNRVRPLHAPLRFRCASCKSDLPIS